MSREVRLNFTGLEIHGEGNDALHVLGEEDGDGARALRDVVRPSEERLGGMGVTTVLPPDNPQNLLLLLPLALSSSFWRLRIPVMSLPPNFESNLPTTAETDPRGAILRTALPKRAGTVFRRCFGTSGGRMNL